MTDEFLTKGLESDRYLKAIQLVDQFEGEIETLLGEFGQRMIDQHLDLFNRPADHDGRSNQRSSSALAIHRINYLMNGPGAPETGQRLNVHLYWMPPTEYGRTDIDGVVRAFGYKIKDADEDIDDRVVKQTRAGDWSLETSGNPFDSNIAFYRHVSSKTEIEDAMETLVDHFSTFGGKYAAGSEE
jgi:hypothetical protein